MSATDLTLRPGDDDHAGRYREMLARARDLAPVLAERAAETEKLRRVPDATLRDLHETGLFRILQPRSIGGSELDYVALIDFAAALAHGCASTAWVFNNLAIHHWMLAMFPETAQDRLWGEDPDVLIASSLIFPCGRAERAAGGYRLSGRWAFSSGVDPCAWNMLGGIVAPASDGDAPDHRIFLVPRADYEIIDTWHVTGLAGTGSKDVAVDNVFVPDDMTLAAADIRGGPTPGSARCPNPVYQIPLVALFPYALSGIGLGNAEAVLDDFVATTRAKSARYSGARLAELQSIQIKIAEAATKVDAARLIMRSDCMEAMDDAVAGRVPDLDKRARYRRNGAWSGNLCTDAVGLLNAASGGGALYVKNRLARQFRDAHAVNAHIAFSFDAAGAAYGRAALGLDPGMPTL